MKDNALSIANYFVDLAKKDKEDVKPLRLMKLVYIAHGYMLAILDRSVLDVRFDRVEAWKYGPVIPSVYHSFKYFKNQAINAKAVVAVNETEFEEPVLNDEDAKKICEFVWNKYKHMDDMELVKLLHKKGTPWQMVYVEGENNEIPDVFTKTYYKILVDMILNVSKQKNEAAK